jgi:hypothetical protein
MVGQEDKLSGITTVQHAKIQSMVAEPLRRVVSCLHQDDPAVCMRAFGEFIDAFERLKRTKL